MLSAIADAAADLATLMDVTAPYSQETARIRIAEAGWALPEMTAAEQALTGQFISGTGGFISDRWLVIAIDLESPVPLDELHFGDTAGRAAWQRVWQGGIGGVVCFDAPPDEDVRSGVAAFLALRGGFGGYKATPAQRQAAIGAGLNYGIDWATVIIVR
jgi:hypothetical protein